jgi:hypothetical protein
MLCELLQIAPDVTDQVVLSRLDIVTREVASKKPSTQDLSAPYHIVHRVFCEQKKDYTLYLDTPWALKSGEYSVHLRGGTEIKNLELHIERHKNLTFLVYNDYTCCSPPKTTSDRISKQDHDQNTQDINSYKSEESVCVISQQLSNALMEIRNDYQNVPGYYPDFEVFQEFSAPYLWLYHERDSIEKMIPKLSRISQHSLGVFLDYIKISFGDEYSRVDALISKGLISSKYLSYLFVSSYSKS